MSQGTDELTGRDDKATDAATNGASDGATAAEKTPEAKLAELGYPLRLPPTGAGRPYEPLIQVGNIVYGSGNTSMDRHTGRVFAGQVGAGSTTAGAPTAPDQVDLETARERARIATLNALAGLKAHLGELSAIRRFVRLTGYVNSGSSFTKQADVINAASELLLEAFGDKGRHARSALGVAQLPGGATVEIEVIVEVEGK